MSMTYMSHGVSVKETRARLENVYSRLQSVGVVSPEPLHRENGRYLISPTHASDRYLTLNEAVEWTMGAVAVMNCMARALDVEQRASKWNLESLTFLGSVAK